MSKPVYGLMVQPRQYKCMVCDNEQLVSTNHTGTCMDRCGNCSWRGAFKKDEYHYLAGTNRPFQYCGAVPTRDQHNPNSGLEWSDPV